MEARLEMIEALNDLVTINTERAEEYLKAGEELSKEDRDLRLFFRQFASESDQHVLALNEVLDILYAEPNAIHGKTYGIWNQMKYPAVEHDRVSILNTCDFIEEAIEKSYDYVINEITLPKEILGILTNQAVSLSLAHDVIKKFNDIPSIIINDRRMTA
ncbi:MAG: PA2169 family four-helix-bundle protein [Bacteroidota bacterium]|nr:PA2169 family four-helix-bundle protein [Bacteroidota bacterium]